jgi:hypothetical protein
MSSVVRCNGTESFVDKKLQSAAVYDLWAQVNVECWGGSLMIVWPGVEERYSFFM